MGEVTRDEAINFLENATRNWSTFHRLSEADIEDVRVALTRFRRSIPVPKEATDGE